MASCYRCLRTATCALALSCGILSVASSVSAAEFRYKPLAFTGQEGIDSGIGPNLSTGEAFEAIVRDPIINNAGEVAFRAFIGENGGTDESVWTTVGGSLQLAVREGTVEAGPNVGDGFFFRPLMTGFNLGDTGVVTFNGDIRGPGIGPTGLDGGWVVDGSGVQAVALPELVDFETGVGNTTLADPSVSQTGNQIYITSEISGTGITSENNWGVWTYKDGSLTNLFRKGETLAAYGLSGGGVLLPSVLNYDSTGNLHMIATYGNTGSSPPNGTRIYTQTPTGFDLVAGTGIADAEALPGIDFQYLQALQTSRTGKTLAFTAGLEGPGVNVANDQSVWKYREGNLEMLVRDGDLLSDPQFGQDTIFGGAAAIDVNDEGTVLLRIGLIGSEITSRTNLGYWIHDGQGLQAVVVEGSDVYGPGFGDGISFNMIETPAIDDTGAVVFKGRVVGDGYNSGNNVGVWRWQNGVITNVLLKGQMLDVNPDPMVTDLRRIDDIDFSRQSLSEAVDSSGSAPFVVRIDFGFAGNTAGVFVITAVPEPDTAVLAIMGLGFVNRRRHPIC